MKTDFNKIVDRNHTKSFKYDFNEKFEVPSDVLPMWVADMDFMTLQPVIDALKETAAHGIYGYSGADESYQKAVLDWMKNHFGFEPEVEEMIQTPGVVFAMAHAIKAFTEPGDHVLIQTPVYYPFKSVTETNGRTIVTSPLVENDGVYTIDFDDFEKKIKENDVKVFILCNPHNPVGRVYTEEELRKLAQICLDNDVLILSDEIHADFIHDGHKHIMLPTLGEDIANQTVLLTAPSKTFNLAGLQGSNIFIKNKELREKFENTLKASGAGGLNIMAYTAGQAAYENGDQWVKDLNDYIEDNFTYVEKYLKENIPQIKTKRPEGTYLMWLDCRDLGMNDEELKAFFLNDAKLWLDEGTMFGEEGSGFMRINVAAPRATVEKAMKQLEQAVKNFIN